MSSIAHALLARAEGQPLRSAPLLSAAPLAGQGPKRAVTQRQPTTIADHLGRSGMR